MSLYKAHRRLSAHLDAVSPSDATIIQELIAAQRGRCPICREPLEADAARVDTPPGGAGGRRAAALHASCRELLRMARALGPEALDRAKERL